MEKSRRLIKRITISSVVFTDEQSDKDASSYVVTVLDPRNEESGLPTLIEEAFLTLQEAEAYASDIATRPFRSFEDYTLMGGW